MTFRLRDPEFVNDPYPYYQSWHREGWQISLPERTDVFVVGHREISSALVETSIGHKIQELDLAIPPDSDPVRKLLTTAVLHGAAVLSDWPLTKNPPHNARLRVPFLATTGFVGQPCVLQWMDETIEACIAKARAEGGFNGAEDLGMPLAFGLNCEMLGVPAADRPVVLSHVKAMEDSIDVDIPEHIIHKGLRAASTLSGYILALLNNDRAKSQPMAVMLRQLADDIEQRKITRREASALGALSLLGGSTTTDSFISTAILGLLSHTSVWKELSTDSALLARALDECLRFHSPVQMLSRRALDDVEVNGRRFAAGQHFRLMLGAGNRDPNVFADPDRFVIGRSGPQPLSMGVGAHYCPGAGRARFMAKHLLQRLSEWAPDLRITGAPVWRPWFHVRSLQSLPLAL